MHEIKYSDALQLLTKEQIKWLLKSRSDDKQIKRAWLKATASTWQPSTPTPILIECLDPQVGINLCKRAYLDLARYAGLDATSFPAKKAGTKGVLVFDVITVSDAWINEYESVKGRINSAIAFYEHAKAAVFVIDISSSSNPSILKVCGTILQQMNEDGLQIAFTFVSGLKVGFSKEYSEVLTNYQSYQLIDVNDTGWNMTAPKIRDAGELHQPDQNLQL